MSESVPDLVVDMFECAGMEDERLEELEELLDIGQSMQLKSGDKKARWSRRRPAIYACCGNCGLTWVAGFLPMSSPKLRLVMSRGGFCVRCLEAREIKFHKVSKSQDSLEQSHNEKSHSFKSRRA